MIVIGRGNLDVLAILAVVIAIAVVIGGGNLGVLIDTILNI